MASRDQVAVITGGAKGIGKETAKSFVDCGIQVVIADYNVNEANETADEFATEQVSVVETDVREESQVEALATKVKKDFNGADVLINNAGVSQTPQSLSEQSLNDWERIIDIHLKGTYLCSKYLMPEMMEQGKGAIINLSSIASFGAFPHRTSYGPAKAAINNLTKVLAIEGANAGVRVNAVAPGYVQTPMVKEGIENGSFDRKPLTDRTPLGRLATPEDIANTITFLASDRAGYITGVVLPVDGGWTAYGHL